MAITVPSSAVTTAAARAPPTDCTAAQAAGAQAGAPRILLVITSFDRGRRLGTKVSGVDKLDYVLMIMDEIREACEVGEGVGEGARQAAV